MLYRPRSSRATVAKKSIVIDLKTDAGKSVLKDLIFDTDVLVQNFRPGAVERLGFGEVHRAVPAAQFDVTPSSIAGPAQKLGECSLEVLLGLGYEQEKCDELLKPKVVSTA